MSIPESPRVPCAPAIPGLAFRLFASPDDYAAMAAVWQASTACLI
jgi:hypothetical protein